MHLKTGGMGKTIRIQYSVIQFFLNPYMDKGFENPKERDWLFCNVFLGESVELAHMVEG